MDPVELQEDLKSEVSLILLETDEEKIKGLHERNELKFFAVRIILNLVKSNTSRFYKDFRKNNIFLSGRQVGTDFNKKYEQVYHIDEIKERYELESLKDLAISEIQNLTWYEQEIVKLYIKLGNYRAIEDDTGIPWESCYKTIQKSLAKIKSIVCT